MNQPKKILVEIHHGLGDVVQMISFISNLKSNFPKSKISVIVKSKPHGDILLETGFVDSIYYLDLCRMSVLKMLSFIQNIRREKYDIGFLSHISNKTLGLFLLIACGCKYRIGEFNKKNHIFKNNIAIKIDKNLHRVDRNLKMLAPLNIETQNYMPMLKLKNEHLAYANSILKKYDCNRLIGICVGANPVEKRKGSIKMVSCNAKQWNIEKYISLINKLLIKGYSIALVGGEKEEREIKPYIDELKDEMIINFINKTNIIESTSILNNCMLVVGCDTGMMHIADALGIKTLTIFGPSNPKLVGAYSNNAKYITAEIDCQYCYGEDRLFTCVYRKCLNSISVEYVYNKVIDILEFDKVGKYS